jgi:hypothetical protein
MREEFCCRVIGRIGTTKDADEDIVHSRAIHFEPMLIQFLFFDSVKHFEVCYACGTTIT